MSFSILGLNVFRLFQRCSGALVCSQLFGVCFMGLDMVGDMNDKVDSKISFT